MAGRRWQRPAEAGQDPFRRQRQLAKAHPCSIINGVDDRGGARHRRRFTGAKRSLTLPIHQQHVDSGQFREGEDRIAAPFAARNRSRFGETHLFLEHAAGRLHDIAVDLVFDTGRIDHHAGILADDHARDGDFPGRAVDCDVGNPGRPGRADARPIAVHVARLRETAAAHGLRRLLILSLRPDMRFPAGTLGRRFHQFSRPLVFEVAQPERDRIFTGLMREFIDEALMREHIRQRRDAAQPRGAHDRRHVVGRDAHIFVIVGRDRGAVTHLQGRGLRRQPARQQQRQCRGSVGWIARLKIVSGERAVRSERTGDIHDLRRALGLPEMFLFARQLNAHRCADRTRQQNGIG